MNSHNGGPSEDVATASAKFAWINNVFACGLAICLNTVVALVLSKNKNMQGHLKTIVIVLKVFDILFSVLFIVACPIFGAIETSDDFTGLMIVNAGIQLPAPYSMIVLMMSIVLLTQQIFHSPISSYSWYLQVCRKGTHFPHIMMILLINCVFLTLTAGLLCHASAPTIDDVMVLSSIAVSYVGHETAFLVLSYEKREETVSSIISSLSYVITLLFSVGFMIFAFHRINKKIQSNVTMSENLKKLQKRANKILISSFIMTLIFIQLPFFYSVLGPMIGASQKLATYLLSILFVWGPAVNAASLFVTKTDVRSAVFFCKRERESVIQVMDRSQIKSEINIER